MYSVTVPSLAYVLGLASNGRYNDKRQSYKFSDKGALTLKNYGLRIGRGGLRDYSEEVLSPTGHNGKGTVGPFFSSSGGGDVWVSNSTRLAFFPAQPAQPMELPQSRMGFGQCICPNMSCRLVPPQSGWCTRQVLSILRKRVDGLASYGHVMLAS